MKRLVVFLSVLLVALYLGSTPALAQHGRGGGGPGAGAGHENPNATSSSPHGGASSKSSTTGGSISVNDHLANNTKLASKLEGILGLNSLSALQAKADGFKNLGQFVAAVHVSKNLGISFDDLRTKMLAGDSLGKAIHEINPNVNAKAEAKKGKKEADADIKESKS